MLAWSVAMQQLFRIVAQLVGFFLERKRRSTPQGLRDAAVSGSTDKRLPDLYRHFIVSHGWIPAFAGMTRAGLAGRDAAVVSKCRLTRSFLSGKEATKHNPRAA
jgi:hypothetical protein